MKEKIRHIFLNKGVKVLDNELLDTKYFMLLRRACKLLRLRLHSSVNIYETYTNFIIDCFSSKELKIVKNIQDADTTFAFRILKDVWVDNEIIENANDIEEYVKETFDELAKNFIESYILGVQILRGKYPEHIGEKYWRLIGDFTECTTHNMLEFFLTVNGI